MAMAINKPCCCCNAVTAITSHVRYKLNMPYLHRGTVFTLVIRTQSTHCWNSSIHFFPWFIDSGRKGTFCGAHGCQSVALQRSAKSISCYTATISTIACCTKTIRPYGEMLHVALTLDSSLDTSVYSVLQDMTRKACTDMPYSRCCVVLRVYTLFPIGRQPNNGSMKCWTHVRSVWSGCVGIAAIPNNDDSCPVSMLFQRLQASVNRINRVENCNLSNILPLYCLGHGKRCGKYTPHKK